MSKPTPWVKFESDNNNYGRFIVSPLERGMGVTLGNSMRRVLLSSLDGYGLTSVLIKDIQHEFSTIQNVVEDVLDIINNIKGVVFIGHFEGKKELTLNFKGKGKVTAKEIEHDADVVIVNPDAYIAELTGEGELNILLTLEKGIGYEPSEVHENSDSDVNTIAIDTSFSPIVRVNHNVENIRIGKELDFDKLILDVWTNGSVTPDVAVKKASDILADKVSLFQKLNEEPAQEVLQEEEVGAEPVKSALALSIDDLELSARSSNCLKRAGIETVGELVEKDITELTQIKNFGKKSADEINDKLKNYNLALKMPVL